MVGEDAVPEGLFRTGSSSARSSDRRMRRGRRSEAASPSGSVRLHRRRIGKIEYWEAWTDAAGSLVVHRGRVGERGGRRADRGRRSAARTSACARSPVPSAVAASAEAEACELGLVLVQFPGERAYGRFHGRAIAWLRDVLGWTGLGEYIGFDDGGDLTLMGEAIDPELRRRRALCRARDLRPPDGSRDRRQRASRT